MRRLLQDVAEKRPLGDTTTLADPAVVDGDQDARRRGADRGVSSPERQLGVALFNEVWRLMETREDDDRMVERALRVGVPLGRGAGVQAGEPGRCEWQLSRRLRGARPSGAARSGTRSGVLQWCESRTASATGTSRTRTRRWRVRMRWRARAKRDARGSAEGAGGGGRDRGRGGPRALRRGLRDACNDCTTRASPAARSHRPAFTGLPEARSSQRVEDVVLHRRPGTGIARRRRARTAVSPQLNALRVARVEPPASPSES